MPEEVMHWQKILFRLPSGKSGRAFVSKLCRLFHAYATGSALELLQRPHHRSKNDDNISHLNRRLCLWNKGDIDGLVSKGRVLQRVLSLSKPSRMGKSSLKDNIAQKFSDLMMCGRVKDALRLLSEDNCGGPLSMSSSVMNALKTKHPKKQAPVPSTLVGEPHVSVPPPHPIVFDQLDAICIHHAVLKTSGAAGPSGLDAAAWCRICTSFQRASSDLCDALSAVARRLCATFVDPAGLSAFVSCHLIALDKCPGVRPIGVGETVPNRCIIAKAVLSVIKEDIREAAGSSQLCTGQLSGCEAAVHSVRTLFGSPDTEAAMSVDATNAFNSLNYQATLRNIQHLCPSFSAILINTYRVDVALYIEGSTLLSEEGTTQGDPLAMPMYALGVLPLINCISGDLMQVWYADNATACGSLSELRLWWDKLLQFGPDFGYFPNPSKTCLVVKEVFYDAAVKMFQGSGISITVNGKRHLGGALGSPSFITSFVKEEVSTWAK